MINFIEPLIGVFIGIIATLLVSRYYYRRTFNKSLTPYVQFCSSPLKGIDPEVKKELQISYKSKEIENLYEIQFLIANTGDKALFNFIEPLTLKVLGESVILDVNIVYISPEGRKIEKEISHQTNEVKYIFSLLNSGDFFITKLLINGSPKIKDFKFTIEADELPPNLKSRFLPYDCILTSKKREFVGGLLIVGLILLLMGISISKLIFGSWSSLPSFDKYGVSIIFHLGLSGWALLFSIIPAFLLLLTGLMVSIGSFTNFKFPSAKNKFYLPDNVISRRMPFEYKGDEDYDFDQTKEIK